MTKLATPKMLIVDDQRGIRVLLDEVFTSRGYITFQASNGIDALEIVRLHSPDIIILDWKIPEMDGVEIQKRVRLIDSSIKVVFITAYSKSDFIDEIYKHGALTYFTKPFDLDEFEEYIHSALNINKEQLISMSEGLGKGQNPVDLPHGNEFIKYCDAIKKSGKIPVSYEQFVNYLNKY